MSRNIVFDDVTIQQIFGFEDAESESIDRLREYYLKKDTYTRITADLPIRILVGHKGTGKSALFKVAMEDEREKGNLPIMIRPDDIAELGKSDDNFLLKIRQWKWGLTKIIGEKVFREFNLNNEVNSSKLGQFGLKLLSFITETISAARNNIDLSDTQKKMIDNYLEKKKIVVYIDDLDRGWEGKKDDILRISALLNSIRDMANENPGILFKVSLRSDVFYLVRTADESTDKIEGNVVWCKWTNHEILVLLIKRIQTFFGNQVDEEKLLAMQQHHLSYMLDDVIEHKFYGWGKRDEVPTYKVIMSMVRKRPRDIVKLCSLAAAKAREKGDNLIKTDHFRAIFEEYSQGRMQDTINEYKSELPDIKRLLFEMRPTTKERESHSGYLYSTQELRKKINSIIQHGRFTFAGGNQATAQDLAHFLYKINFLTARKVLETGEISRKYFEENRYLLGTTTDFGYDWEIHPAFRWALQPEGIDDIMMRLFRVSDD